MSSAAPPTIAVVLPPREGFGPRRARGIGLTARYHALAASAYRTVVFGGKQSGPIFLDVTFRLVRAPFFIPGTTWARYMLGLIPALRRLKPVAIEVHAEPRIALWLQRMFPTIPVVLVQHDDPEANPLTRTPDARSELFRRLARIVAVSAWVRDRLLDEIDPPPRAPLIVPPCVDIANLPVTAGGLDAASTPVAKRRTRLILFVGRLTAEKGADLFVSACSSALAFLPGWRAEIIGAAEHMVKGPETPFTRLLNVTAEPASIGMMGYRDHPDVMAAMARAAIVVVPSPVPEPSGRVVLEAMANGAVVICSRDGAFPEIAGAAAAYVDPTDIAELSDTIRALGGDPRRLTALAEAGRQRAAQFDLPRAGRMLEAVRAQVIADGPPAF
jgi:UDP-glucose:(glucosyl)LPS alpha-1,2-glucosyltransferase